MLRSTGSGTQRVQTALNPGRAMTLCWRAKSPSRPAFSGTASAKGYGVPESMLLGTIRLPTNPAV